MFIFKTIGDLQRYLTQQRVQNHAIGFVPTMGALHAGHISLITHSRRENEVTVCSIFVNPTQFNDIADLQKYPRTTADDVALLAEAGCEALFLPEVDEIYPNGMADWHNPYTFGALTQVMEGAHRPGHFEGMVQVVHRLLDIVAPHRLYMGQKDFQQQCIVQSMLQQSGIATRLVCCPIMREKDGLAMSSRNIRLSVADRTHAPVIYKTLQQAALDAANYAPQVVRSRALHALQALPNSTVDYFEVVAADSLLPVDDWQTTANIVACTTVRLGGVRLLDNLFLR